MSKCFRRICMWFGVSVAVSCLWGSLVSFHLIFQCLIVSVAAVFFSGIVCLLIAGPGGFPAFDKKWNWPQIIAGGCLFGTLLIAIFLGFAAVSNELCRMFQ